MKKSKFLMILITLAAILCGAAVYLYLRKKDEDAADAAEPEPDMELEGEESCGEEAAVPKEKAPKVRRGYIPLKFHKEESEPVSA